MEARVAQGLSSTSMCKSPEPCLASLGWDEPLPDSPQGVGMEAQTPSNLQGAIGGYSAWVSIW